MCARYNDRIGKQGGCGVKFVLVTTPKKLSILYPFEVHLPFWVGTIAN